MLRALRLRRPARLVGLGTTALAVAAATASLSIRLAALPIGIAAWLFVAAAVEWLVPARLKIVAQVIYAPLLASYIFGVALVALDQHDPARFVRLEAHYRLSDRIEYGIDLKNVGGLQACNEHIRQFLSAPDPSEVVKSLDSCSRTVRPGWVRAAPSPRPSHLASPGLTGLGGRVPAERAPDV
jgi:hypothetical protein